MRNSYNTLNANSKEKEKKCKADNLPTTLNRWEKRRPCLKCGREFASQGPYNRICDTCGLINVRHV